MADIGIEAPQFAVEIRKLFWEPNGLWNDAKNRDLASAQERFRALFELSAGLPEGVRNMVRIKIAKIRDRLDYPIHKVNEISDEGERKRFIGKIIGEALSNWTDGANLRQVAFELDAWLPSDPMPSATIETMTAPRAAPPTGELTDEDKAIALAVQDHQLSIADIADKLGVNRGTPYRWLKFKPIFKALQAGRAGAPPPRGCKDRDGNLEAEDDSE